MPAVSLSLLRGVHPAATNHLLSAACSITHAVANTRARQHRAVKRHKAMSVEAFQVADKNTEGPGHEAEWQWPPESDGWVLSHNALRQDLKDFGRLLGALQAQLAAGRAVEPWQADAIRRYWQHAVHMLVVHHDSEEELYFPLMRTRFPVEAKQTSDHLDIVRSVDRCSAELDAVLEAQGGAAEQAAKLKQLQSTFSGFQRLCLDHFKEEEEVTLPLLRHHFTPEEVRPVAKKISKMFSLLDMGNYLRPMSHEERVQWMTRVRMPFFIQWLMLAQVWRYDRDVIRPFEGAIKGEKPAWSLF